MITVDAPAKINLTLEVLSKRADGYHDIKSVVQTISLGDSLEFEASAGMDFHCDEIDWLAGESLVPGAAVLLKEASGYRDGVIVNIAKKIPLLSGMGGDSSDAAAALVGLNRLWGLNYPAAELERLAGRLGSDVPFFLHGGTALITGRGEVIEPLPPMKQAWLVLLLTQMPRTPGKTGRLYGRLSPSDFTDGRVTDKVVSLLNKGRRIGLADIFNVFGKVAFQEFDGLEGYRRLFLRAGALGVRLAGSGPTLFTLAQDEKEAGKIYQNLTRLGLQAVIAKTVAVAA